MAPLIARDGHDGSWPITSVRCAATIRPVPGVKPTWHGRRSIDAI